jgi:DNA polymerase-3 subunit gamma/tau
MSGSEYRVLARKYRPMSFGELIGHEALVRTLTNAFNSGRIAHAFMLTGVRGVGKTTTARLIARALNCVNGPTMTPCGTCDACRAIAEDRHPDVLEMDAASRTGVEDMRELIDGVRYRPVSARYKVYIIDEVHMLSKAAFNALLKTLEEPPPDIKFIFATTEINRVPVTVLSRCQRYTLPRIPAETLSAYFGTIAQKENCEAEPTALALIARAADGSVRDGLSILDQAIALALGAPVTEQSVRDMLGVADRGLVLDLFEALMRGDAGAALDQLGRLYDGGTDPGMVLQDLLDVTHYVTRLKLERPNDAAAAAEPVADGLDRQRCRGFADRLGIAQLGRVWQVLLKGLAEVLAAPHPLKAAEMVLVRLVHVGDLPSPADLVRLINEGRVGGAGGPAAGGNGGGGPRAEFAPGRPVAVAVGGGSVATPLPVADTVSLPASFAELMALVARHREGILYDQLATFVHLVRYAPGVVEFRPAASAPRDLASRLSQFLQGATGARWMVGLSSAEGEPTLRQRHEAEQAQERAEVLAHPLVQAVLAAFPGARIERILNPQKPAATPLEPPGPTPEPVEEAPALYEEDDPGPFAIGAGRDLEDEPGDDR